MINSKIMQFEQAIMKIIQMYRNDGVPEAAIYLALTNATHNVMVEMNKKIQEEYKEANTAEKVGEPIVEDLHHDEDDEDEA